MLFHDQDQLTALTLLYEGAPLNNAEWVQAKTAHFISLGRKIKRRLFLQDIPPASLRGPAVVQTNLIEGLRRLGYETSPFGKPFNFKPSSQVGVLSGALDALPWAIHAKEKGWVEKLVAGPNLVVMPEIHDGIITHPAIDVVVTPSHWVSEIYRRCAPSLDGKIVEWVTGVDTAYWSPANFDEHFDFLIFNKIYGHDDARQIKKHIATLQSANFTYRVLEYGKFSQAEFRRILQASRALIYCGKAESQGISLFEAWACNVPTLVQKCDSWHYQGSEFNASAAPYLTDACGMFFDPIDFHSALDTFREMLPAYEPRNYILQKFTLESSAQNYLDMF